MTFFSYNNIVFGGKGGGWKDWEMSSNFCPRLSKKNFRQKFSNVVVYIRFHNKIFGKMVMLIVCVFS